MGIVFCLIATSFFSALCMLLGRSQKRGVEPMGINLAAFATGVVASLCSRPRYRLGDFPPRLILVACLIGIMAGFGLLATTIAVRAGVPVAIVNSAVRLCLIVPVLLSALLYHEAPGLRKGPAWHWRWHPLS
jgi:hypothetical protein